MYPIHLAAFVVSLGINTLTHQPADPGPSYQAQSAVEQTCEDCRDDDQGFSFRQVVLKEE